MNMERVTYKQFFVRIIVELDVVCHFVKRYANLGVVIDTLVLASILRYCVSNKRTSFSYNQFR